jgi:predicted RNA-binding Zn-ribbon protein involved in translation (DUF1610 family)
MKICGHCNSLMGFDPRFNAFVCPHCGQKMQRAKIQECNTHIGASTHSAKQAVLERELAGTAKPK